MIRKSEALLLISSIGGGFAGITVTFGQIFNISYFTLGHFIIFGSALSLFGYFIYAGLSFANDKINIKHLKIAFLLQIPWFTSPILSYKIASGLSLSCLFYPGSFNFLYNIGSDFSFGIFDGQTWGIGFNLAAVGLYFVAMKYTLSVPNKNLKSDS